MRRLLAAASIAVALGSPAAAQPADGRGDSRQITVSGDAVVEVEPDRIVIALGIETHESDILAAKQANGVILERTVAALGEVGVQRRDIQVDQLSIEPRWRDQYEQQDFLGYFVRNTIVVTVRDVAKVEAVVTRVLQAGINYIHGVDFQTTALKAHRERARQLALEAAREKAVKMAGALGQSIGAPMRIDESYAGAPWWSGWNWTGWGPGRQSSLSQVSQLHVSQDGAGPDAAGAPWTLGRLSVRAGVSVTFALID